MTSFPSIETLCRTPEPFPPHNGQDRLFAEAMRENYAFQYQAHPFVRALADREGFSPDRLRLPADVFRIPPLFVGTMKINRFCSVPEQDIALTLTSSGTRGQKTQLLMDRSSLERLNVLADNVFKAIGFKDPRPAHALVFGYDRGEAAELGTSWSDEQVMRLTPTLSEHWLIRRHPTAGEFRFDARAAADLLIELSLTGQPIRMLGFPAFMHEAVEQVHKIKPNLRVHSGSFVVAGGGWKNHIGVPLTHARFAAYLEKALGLPAANVRDTFGMAEHGVPYAACRLGRHHVPVYARVRAVDPLTLRPLADGREGLLHLLTPYNIAQPNCSVLSTDLAAIGRDCDCGLPGVYLSSIRRGGLTLHKGCALAAQEILDRAHKKGE